MFVKSFWPAFLWGIVIVLLSSTNGDTVPSAPWMKTLMIDKWVHFVIYYLFYVLIYLGLVKYNANYKIIFGFLFCVSFGVLMEIFQHYFWLNRSGDLIDVLANTFGVIIGILTADFWVEKWKKIKNILKKCQLIR